MQKGDSANPDPSRFLIGTRGTWRRTFTNLVKFKSVVPSQTYLELYIITRISLLSRLYRHFSRHDPCLRAACL